MIIHTVYKPEENLDYLDDWLNHHTKIGIDHFYMYDNGDGTGNHGMKRAGIDPQYNKSGFKHKYSLEIARERQQDIFKKYNVTHVIWEPKDDCGNILYNWKDSTRDFFASVKTGLCAFIDIDEFIIKHEEFKPSRLTQVKYKSMHYYKSVYDCYDRCIIPQPGVFQTKCILDLSTSLDFNQHYDQHFVFLELPTTKNYYNHYNYSELRHTNLKLEEYSNPIVSKFRNIPFEELFVIDLETGLVR